MTRAAIRAILGLVAVVLSCGFQAAPTPAPFSDWAAIVVAADWRASNGRPTAAFDNARRDVSTALIRAGFRRENLRSYAVEPSAGVGETNPRNVFVGLTELARKAPGGCLVYMTSHGSPDGIVFGRNGQLPPAVLGRLLNATCRDRPTVVMISACFSGVYVPALSAPDRLVVTAARRDRTSFGCGEDDTYPFFDGCVLENFPRALDFLALARGVQACVARRETELKLSPASEPQISAGARIRPLLPLLPLNGAEQPAP
ncbi:MAG: C13 family peptidase [Proteobacteria bacterium]|nr:C13 family peptidase [Pseudomonadota bacterium]MBW3616328.1 C13 family peptidase [Pseudomonadota bacterium]